RPHGQPQPQQPLRGPHRHRARAPHGPVGRTGRRRRGGPAMSAGGAVRRGVREALLVLADGATFEGEAIGADAPGGVAAGEVVFNTALSGYQEIISDPSYAGQIITFTYPHIGNYGATPDDDESRHPF